MKQVKWWLLLLVPALALRSLAVDDDRPKKPPRKLDPAMTREVSDLMRRKLQHSQKVLEGIALNDFERIAKHADELILVSKQTEWKVVKTPDYELYSNDLRRSAEELIRKSRDRNLDGATLAYVDLTLTCVRCHKHVRDSRR